MPAPGEALQRRAPEAPKPVVDTTAAGFRPDAQPSAGKSWQSVGEGAKAVANAAKNRLLRPDTLAADYDPNNAPSTGKSWQSVREGATMAVKSGMDRVRGRRAEQTPVTGTPVDLQPGRPVVPRPTPAGRR